jgi:nitrate reductase delta subunit
MRPFERFIETTPLSRLEEIYTATFDVNPASFIYAGYLLFGESFKRNKFMVRLQEKYREHGFSLEKELADHIPTIFRFLARLDPDEILAHQLENDCLIPSLKLMTTSFSDDSQESNPYARLLDAVLIVLNEEQYSLPDTQADSVHQPMRSGD